MSEKTEQNNPWQISDSLDVLGDDLHDIIYPGDSCARPELVPIACKISDINFQVFELEKKVQDQAQSMTESERDEWRYLLQTVISAALGWHSEFRMYRNAWLREMGGIIRAKAHEIDGFVLRTRDIFELSEQVPGLKKRIAELEGTPAWVQTDALREIRRLLNFDYKGWEVRGDGIYSTVTGLGPFIRDAHCDPKSLALICDALNFFTKRKMALEICESALAGPEKKQ